MIWRLLLTKYLWILFGCGLSLASQAREGYTVSLAKTDKLHVFEELQNMLVYEGMENASYIGATGQYINIKVEFEKSADKEYLIINNCLFDTIICYKTIGSRLVDSLIVGQALPYDNRLFGYQDFIFSLTKGDERVTTLYFIIKSSKPINFSTQIKSHLGLLEKLTVNDLVFGFFAGVILVMLLYNFIIFFVVKDDSYLYYVAYLFCMGLAQASLFGYTDRFFFGNMPWWSNNFSIICGALIGISSLLFVRRFLHLHENSRFFSELFKVFIAIDFLAIIICIIGYRIFSYNLINSIAFLGALGVIYVSLQLVKKGYKPAQFFFIAWVVFLLSVFIHVFKEYDILPYNSITRRAILTGSILETILLSLALADKFNVLRKEKEESQAEALQVSKENERIIREQNILLEQKVQERTLELQESNEELQVTLANLKDTQTQLVDAEKMASLGQLTAGIAHEINNPINFVTSNIAPLRRDLNEIYEILESYSSIDDNAPLEGLSKARKMEEDYDFQYLKEEIDSLVSGISDGATRTSEIVKGLRTFSRLDEDTIKQANIHDGLDSTLILLRNKIKDVIEFNKIYADEMPEIDCYPGKLNQVFMNILNNAIYAVSEKHYREGEKPVLTIRTENAGGKVKVYLKDNGIGMDEQTKRKIFDPFFTTKDVGEGTGLGMSIVFKIIEKHNGSIEVESEKGKGTEFIITLPLRLPNQFE